MTRAGISRNHDVVRRGFGDNRAGGDQAIGANGDSWGDHSTTANHGAAANRAAGGDGWHVSSHYFAAYRKGAVTRKKIAARFGLWDVAAKVLAGKSRLFAA